MDRGIANTTTKSALGVLQRWADTNGYVVKREGSSRYDGQSVVVKFRIYEGNEGLEALNSALARMHGLREDVVGQQFVLGGTEYCVTGINSRRPKYPISADRVKDGRSFKFTTESVRSQLT